MSDQNVMFQPAQGSDGQASTGAEQAPDQPITRREVEILISRAFDISTRQAQSLTDKMDSRLRKELATRLAAVGQNAKLLGIEMTPEVAENVRRKVIDEYLTQPEIEQAPAEAQLQPGQQPVDPTDKAALDMMRKAGTYIEQIDPEAKTLDMTDPGAYLLSMAQAIEAKRQRLAKTSQPAQVRTPTIAGATGAQVGLEAQYRSEINNAQTKDARLQIRRKYRGLGLEL